MSVSDDEIVDRVCGGESPLFELLMRRYNQRLFRVARAIVRDEHEAEDVMQAAYVAAYTHLAQYARRAKFSTWLTRIAVHEALARTRRRARWEAFPESESERGVSPPVDSRPDPERQAHLGELRREIEAAIDDLPERYRTAFVLREAEGLATREVADCLDISEEAVRTRVHRARVLLRRRLFDRTGATAASAFSFHLVRCDRVVAGVFRRLSAGNSGRPAPARGAVSGRGGNGVESPEHREHDDDLGPGPLPDLRFRRSRHDRSP